MEKQARNQDRRQVRDKADTVIRAKVGDKLG